MGYTLTLLWKQRDQGAIHERRETSEGGGTYAETERRARALWAGTASVAGTERASTVVEILDLSGRTVACLKDTGTGLPSLTIPGEGEPANMRWLNHLRMAGVLAERVRDSTERLARMDPVELAGEPGIAHLDAAASRLGALVYRVDEMVRHSWTASGGDPTSRMAVRRTIHETMDEADVDGFLAMTMDNRIPVPPSTLAPQKVPALVEAVTRVSSAMLSVCGTIEAHALGEEPSPSLAPGA